MLEYFPKEVICSKKKKNKFKFVDWAYQILI